MLNWLTVRTCYKLYFVVFLEFYKISSTLLLIKRLQLDILYMVFRSYSPSVLKKYFSLLFMFTDLCVISIPD